MSQPHHFVFNEIERVIRSSVPDNERLVDLLVRKNVLREKDRPKFVGRNGMKCLTSYMRIKDFETFVTFVECIREVSEQDPSVDVSVVETIRGAVRTFDENHSTHYEQRIPQLKKTTEVVPVGPETVLPADEVAVESASDVVNELDLLTLVRDASRVTVGPKGGTLSSPLTDFEITVPAGAVQDQVTITAATSAWGSFNIPNDVYRISDYICVTSTGHLSASVTIQIAHCLSMPEYRSTPAIVIYHADLTHYKPSEGFRFTLLDAIPHVSSTKPFVSFEVQEFCIFCAVYRPQHYRGTQKQASSHSSRGAHSRPGPVSPYDRPTIPRLDYVLLYYEQKLVTVDSPYKVQIFSCINCPGAIEFCNKKMDSDGIWKKPMSKNFDFTSSKIVFMEVTEVKSEGWAIAVKSPCITECEIQRPEVTRYEGKKIDKKRADWYNLVCYPPSMALEVVRVSRITSHLKINITIKDGRDGEVVIPGSYQVVLPNPSWMFQEREPNTNLDGNRNVQPPPPPTKRSLSVEEEQCLEETVSTLSLARVSSYIQKWEPVAKELLLSERDISHIEQECSYNYETMSERIFLMLDKWYRCSECRTYKVLVDALKNCEEYEAVNYILGNIKLLTDTSA